MTAFHCKGNFDILKLCILLHNFLFAESSIDKIKGEVFSNFHKNIYNFTILQNRLVFRLVGILLISLIFRSVFSRSACCKNN